VIAPFEAAVKNRLFAFLHASGLTRLAAWWNRKRVTILCYHGVTERGERGPDDPFGLHVRRARFVAQLDHLARYYRVVSLRDYLEAKRERRPLPDYSVVLTFDDGYRNILTVAAPCLSERGLPASIFLITDRVREKPSLDLDLAWAPGDDEAYLTWDEVGELERSQALEFGSHTRSHPKLSLLSKREMELELVESRAAITDHSGSGSVAFAYPYGDYSDSVVAEARAAGYICALTTDEGPNHLSEDLFTLRRTLIGDDDDVPAFAARVSGLAAWMGRAAAFLRKSRPGSRQSVGRSARPEQT
jgi:peptidoglycan/xylan/chitin deacetylase (PgdA/CDA1 family)